MILTSIKFHFTTKKKVDEKNNIITIATLP